MDLRHLSTPGLVASHETSAEGNGRFRLFRSFTVSTEYMFSIGCLATILTSTSDSVIIPMSLRLGYVRSANASSRSIYTSVAVTIITVITTHTAIMSSTLPCMKQFLAMFESGELGEYTEETYTGTGTGSGKGTRTDHSIALTSLASGSRGKRDRKARASDELELRSDQVVSDTIAEVSADASSAVSDQSGGTTIKKTQKWEITYERW